MSIRKLAVAVAVGVFAASGAVFAQGAPAAPAAAPAPAPAPAVAPAPAAVEEAAAEAVEEEVVEEEVAAPEPVAAPEVAAEPAPAVEAAPAAVAPAAKPETKVDFYGTASYRFRGRLWNATATVKEAGEDVDKSGSSFDYLNLLGWSVGLKAKVDDQLSLQFQIGNDVTAGESITWWNNKAPQGRAYIGGADNLYVHLAYASWNPGSFSLTGGVIPVVSNGTLDLLERSLSTGSYGDAIFQTWSTQLNNSLIALKLGVPLVKEDVKVSAELTYSVIDPRSQTLITGIGTTGASGVDPATGLIEEPKAAPTSQLIILDVPIAAGDFKVTPQVTYVANRNYNTKLEKGDDETLFGLSASYKATSAVSFSLNGAYGTVSNENSLVGRYGNNGRSDTNSTLSGAYKYISNGLIGSLGSTIKAGPGAFQIGVSYGNSYNSVDGYSYTSFSTKYDTTFVPGTIVYETNEEGEQVITSVVADKYEVKSTNEPKVNDVVAQKDLTNKNDILFDLRYTWNVHPKFTIVPRWRVYVTTYDEGSGHVGLKMENRPELILTGSF